MSKRTTLDRTFADLVMQGIPGDVPEERIKAHLESSGRFHDLIASICETDLDQIDLPLLYIILSGGKADPVFPRLEAEDFQRIIETVQLTVSKQTQSHPKLAYLWTKEDGLKIELHPRAEDTPSDTHKAILYLLVKWYFGLATLKWPDGRVTNRFDQQVNAKVDKFYEENAALVEEAFNNLLQANSTN